MSEKSVKIDDVALNEPSSVDQIRPEGDMPGVTRAGIVEQLGIVRPTGDLEGDLKGNEPFWANLIILLNLSGGHVLRIMSPVYS